MVIAADQSVRDEALDPQQSFIVSAPAGSGKTELLTQRVLSLLSTVNSPEEVLAITFTKKAAGEMRQRVLEGIRKGLSPEPELAHEKTTWELANTVLEKDKALNWRLLENPNRLRIQTIDSFCASLTRQMPLLSSMGGTPEVAEEPYDLYLEATQNLFKRLEQASDVDDPIPDTLGRLLLHFDNKLPRLQQILMAMLAQRDQWLPHVVYGAVSIREGQQKLREQLELGLVHLIEDAIQRLAELIPEHWWSELQPIIQFICANLKKRDPDNVLVDLEGFFDNRNVSADTLSGWQCFAEFALTKQGGIRKSLTKGQGFLAQTEFKTKEEKEQAKGFKALAVELLKVLAEDERRIQRLNMIRALPFPTYSDAQWQTVGDLLQVLPALVAELFIVFQQRSQVDFIQIAASASDALGDELAPTELAMRLDYSIQHILVDEFQDTSQNQIRLLEKLTLEWQPQDGRTLFLVGDAMQSIYRFRASDVSLFLKVKELGLPNVALKPLNLTVNFRSQADVVQWVNTTFSSAFPAEDDISVGAVRYSESVPFKKSLENEAIKYHLFEKSEDGSHVDAEAEKIASQVSDIRKDDPEASVAVLIRSRAQVPVISAALAEACVPVQAVDIDPLANNEAVIDMCTLTRAILHPGDKIAWLALLRAPWCGLTLRSLQLIEAYGQLGQPIYFKISAMVAEDNRLFEAAEFERLKRVQQIVEPIIATRARKPLRQVLEGAWQALGGFDIYPEAELSNIESYLDLVEQHVGDGSIFRFEEIEKKLGALYVKPMQQQNNPVQIVTLHKSKGLQYDYVFIPGLDRRTRGDDKQLLRWRERVDHQGDVSLVMAPVEPTGASKDPIYNCLALEEKERAALESIRLLYVGCTRAIKQLHLLASLKVDDEKVTVPKNTLLEPLWSDELSEATVQKTTEPSVPSSQLEEAVATDIYSINAPVRQLKRVADDFQATAFEQEDLLANYKVEIFAENEENVPTLGWSSDVDAKVGTLMHRILRQVVLGGLSVAKSWDMVERMGIWRVQLLELGVVSEEVEPALDRLQQAITRTLDDPKASLLFDHDLENSATEKEIMVSGRSGPRKLILDRFFTDDKGTHWVVDYKLVEAAADTELEAFYSEQAEIYSSIMMQYVQAAKALHGGEVKAALYFPLHQHLHEY